MQQLQLDDLVTVDSMILQLDHLVERALAALTEKHSQAKMNPLIPPRTVNGTRSRKSRANKDIHREAQFLAHRFRCNVSMMIRKGNERKSSADEHARSKSRKRVDLPFSGDDEVDEDSEPEIRHSKRPIQPEESSKGNKEKNGYFCSCQLERQ